MDIPASSLGSVLAGFTEPERAVIAGAIVGDGFISRPPVGNSQLAIGHTASLLPYLEWKASALARFSPKVSYRSRKRTGAGREDPFYAMVTGRSPLFSELRAVVYADGKKTVTPEILHAVTARALALWFLDQGSVWGSNVRLHTERHGPGVTLLIRDWPEERYGLDAHVVRAGRGKVRLSLTRAGSDSLVEIMRGVLPAHLASMLPRLPCSHRGRAGVPKRAA